MTGGILVTGGAGFVGSSLCLLLKKDFPKSRIIAFDNLKRRGSELNLERFRKHGIEFIHGDIRNPGDLATIGGVDTLIECAAEPSVLAGYDGAPNYVIDTNLKGTINCLEFARRHRSSFVFLSTSRVYPISTIANLKYREDKTRLELLDEQDIAGASSFGISENFPLEGFRSLYGATKLSSELIFSEYLQMYGLRGVINRCGVLTGPWQMGKIDQGVVVLWAAHHYFGGKLSYLGYGGTGKQVRDLLHVRDLYDLLKIQLADLDRFNGRIFNIGGGREISVSLAELTALCQKYSGKNIEITSQPSNREGDIPCYLSDCRRIEDFCGWKARTSADKIIEEIMEWIRENESQLKPILS